MASDDKCKISRAGDTMTQDTIDRIRRFSQERDWDQFHTPANLAKSISIEANELDALELEADEIINAKMDQNEAKYPVEKCRGRNTKYDQLD